LDSFTVASRPVGKHAAARPARGAAGRAPKRSSETPTHPLGLRPEERGRHRRTPHRGAAATFRAAAPRVIGAAALAVATTGAVHAPPASPAVTASTPFELPEKVQPAGVAGDVSDVIAVIESRKGGKNGKGGKGDARVSRDSARQALEDATPKKLRPPRAAKAKEENAEVARLASEAEKAAKEIAANAWQLPLDPGTYRLTGRFGQCSSLWSHCHTGLDFAAPMGTPVKAVANGTVTEVGWAGAYGNRVILTLDDGTELWFAHLTSAAVSVGQQVVGGQPIGYVGSTGNSTGPHLHLEVRPGGGDAVDPVGALSVNGVTP
jgi:murein DD-endopeptidase MepM/ murein hydrolase activator NlpD